MRASRTRFVVLAIAFACIVASLALALALRYAIVTHDAKAPDFTLTDQDGRAFSLASQRGRPVAIFFGYTHCPDACPLVLARLAKALRSDAVARATRVVFITVDPEHDDPATLKRYLAAFDPSFVGVTGTPAQLEPVYAAYHITRVPQKGGGSQIEIAHETAIFLVSPSGTMTGIADGDDDASELRAALDHNS